ncbi:DUF3592 domain-containing protein [Kangiella sp. TOML190]|uniref:DUF3592 domain-containing protein n=1 Tax=Kangiella sp. TOML190 TaxID=2931351 RepID=UPI00203DA455|nr:DUF3592 domain-containing protein [Kangiella sp. TOML190]
MANDHKKGLGCLTLFGSVFLLAGVGIFLWQLTTVYQAWGASSWQPTQATLISLEQTVSHSDGSTTYGVKGQFQYQVNGSVYTSKQLNFHSGSDNIGSYQQDFYQKLARIKRNNQTVTAYYNPDNPSEAVIDKNIRWSMLGFGSIFLLAFGGAGGGIIFAGFWGAKKLKQEAAYQQQFVDQPWLWKKEWQGDYFKPNSKSSFITIGIFALFWNLVSIPVAIFAIPEIWHKGEYWGLLILLFPLIGLGLIAWFLVLYSRHKKFGQSKLYLDAGRLKIGALNQGHLQLENTAQAQFTQSVAIIKIASIHKYQSGSGKNRSTREKILWEDTQRVDLNSNPINFQFNLPDNLKPSDDSNSRSQYLWRLSVDSEQQGPDLKLEFDIPAFPLSEQEKASLEAADSDLFSSSSSTQSSFYQSTARGDWTQLGVVKSYNNSGIEYYFPRLNSLTWSMMAVFGLVFVAIGLGVYWHGAIILFPIIFGLIGGLLAIIGLRAALYKSRVFVDGSNLHYQSGHLAFGRTITIPKAAIKKFNTISQASSGNTKFYNILVHTNDGNKHTIAKNLKVKGDVEAFIEQLKSELNYTEA